MKNLKKMLVFVSIFALAMSLDSAASASDPKPSGPVSVETTAVAAGIGYQWGEGVLKYEGKEYKFKVKGFSVVDVGISSVSATGDVYYLYDVTNFSGTYSAAGASIALGAGAGYIVNEFPTKPKRWFKSYEIV